MRAGLSSHLGQPERSILIRAIETGLVSLCRAGEGPSTGVGADPYPRVDYVIAGETQTMTTNK